MKTLFKNGKLVLEDRVLEGYTLVTEGDRILEILPDEEAAAQASMEKGQGSEEKDIAEEICEVDLRGRFVLPGMIDIHSDMIESYIQPRSTAVMEILRWGLGKRSVCSPPVGSLPCSIPSPCTGRGHGTSRRYGRLHR